MANNWCALNPKHSWKTHVHCLCTPSGKAAITGGFSLQSLICSYPEFEPLGLKIPLSLQSGEPAPLPAHIALVRVSLLCTLPSTILKPLPCWHRVLTYDICPNTPANPQPTQACKLRLPLCPQLCHLHRCRPCR